jgi:hypothetical protein
VEQRTPLLQPTKGCRGEQDAARLSEVSRTRTGVAACLSGWLLTIPLFLFLMAPLSAEEKGGVTLAVRLFMIPKEQQFEAAVPDGRGSQAEFQVYGAVTSAFPRGTVFFPTELAANADEGAIGSAIRDRIVFGCGGLAADRISVRELRSARLTLSPDRPKAEERFAESRGEGRTLDYRVVAELISAEKGKALVRLRFDSGWSSMGGRLGVGISEDVFSAPFEIPDSKLLLIGGASSGIVYWLAVCTVPSP